MRPELGVMRGKPRTSFPRRRRWLRPHAKIVNWRSLRRLVVATKHQLGEKEPVREGADSLTEPPLTRVGLPGGAAPNPNSLDGVGSMCVVVFAAPSTQPSAHHPIYARTTLDQTNTISPPQHLSALSLRLSPVANSAR